MFDNFFFLKRVSKELNERLTGFKFFRSISQSKNEIVTGFYSEETEQFVIFTFQQLPSLIYLKNHFAFAKKNYAEFFERLKDKTLKNISIGDFERNIIFDFSSEKLVFMFRGPHSNVVLIDKNNMIIESFKDSYALTDKNFFETFPTTSFDRDNFSNETKFNCSFTSDDFQSNLLKKILGKELLKEITFRSKNFNRSYFETFNEVIFEIENFPLHIYSDNTCSSCELKHKNLEFRLAENFLSEYPKLYFLIQKDQTLKNAKSSLLKKMKSDYEKLFSKHQELNKPENFIDHSEEFRTKGNLILIHANEIKKGTKIFKTSFDNRDYTIKLDVTKSPFENAEIYFEKAREETKRLEALRNLLQKTEQDLNEIKEKINEIENCMNLEELKSYFKPLPKSSEGSIQRYFRHFVIDDKYHVYIGKDSKSNDILTFEFAKSDDLWLHARGVSGSHVIIKKENKKETIPKQIIEKAATLAAYFSKAKHSKLIPVSYTEKKYVIKRKGMLPGTVQLQREKVIMVEPKIPSDAKQVQEK